MSQKRYSLKSNMDHVRQAGRWAEVDALRRAEATLAETQRSFHVGSWDWDLAADTIQFSDEMFRLVGMLPGQVEITREVFSKFLLTDEAEQIFLKFQESASHPFSSIEHHLALPNGEIRTAHTRVRPYRDEHGKLLRLIGSTQDVTDQKRMEEALLESEKRFHSLFDNTTIGIYRTTVDGRILLVNPVGIRILGYDSFEELASRNLEVEGFEPDYERSQFHERMQRDGYIVGLESLWKRKDGSTIYVRESAMAVKDSDGNILFYDGAFEDITEHKQAEEALQQSEWRARIVSELTTDDIFILDIEPDGLLKLRWVSDLMLHLTGRTVEGAATSDIWEGIIHAEDMASFLGFINRTLLRAESSEFECRTYHKAGEERWIRIFVRPQVDGEGRVTTIIGAIKDITEYKQAGIALKQSEAHYHFLADHMTDMVWLMDMNLKFTYVSPSVEKIRGYTFAELQQMPLEQLLTPSSFQSAMRIFSEEFPKALADPTYSPLYTMELDFYRRDGQIQSVESRLSLIRDENGNLVSIMGQDRDIMDRKQAEMERHVLLEIMQGMVSTNDMTEFLELIRLSINKVIPAENYSVVLYDKETNLFKEVYVTDKYDDVPMLPSCFEKSISAYVFRTNEPLLLDQERFNVLAAQGLVELVGTNSACWLGAPLRTANETFGVIVVQDYENQNGYSDRDKDFLAFIGAQVALAVERKRGQDNLLLTKESLRSANLELHQALIREKRISRTDGLTEIHNRRYFFEIAEHEFASAKRYGKALSMIMFDIDHFKGFNDMYGHQAGDEILRYVAQTAARQLRDVDVFARYGGEEFVALLPNTGLHESAIVAERIRESIAAYKMNARGNMVGVTVSVGVAERVESTDSLDRLVQYADRAMYAAKDKGRNSIAVYSA